mmetsp:Transcript_31806/g.69601  ORF Transcript_31806/g.69601 Transcript_31806/m.69601 type:complete len:92 (-) Transcript_31806:252-527(-)
MVFVGVRGWFRRDAGGSVVGFLLRGSLPADFCVVGFCPCSLAFTVEHRFDYVVLATARPHVGQADQSARPGYDQDGECMNSPMIGGTNRVR